MPQESIQALYNLVAKEYTNDFGSFDSFYNSLQDPTKRKTLYDQLSQDGYSNLGDYESFELKVSSKAPAINPNDVFIVPDEHLTEQPSFKNIIYDSVKQQEGSVAKNNPYGVNLPRKKSNVNKILGLGGKVMEGSDSLLEFDNLEGGMKAGEEIIDNILSVSNNDPALFYSNYSGKTIESPEVKSFVKIVGEKSQQDEPKEKTHLQNIMEQIKKYEETEGNNPQYILRALSSPDAAEEIDDDIPKFVMGIPTSKLLGEQRPAFDGIPTPTDKEAQEKLDKEREELGLPFKPDVATAQNYLFFKKEIAKEKKKGLSDFDAYKKIRSDLKLPSEIVENAMEMSITGSLFRIFGLEQPTDVSFYKEVLQQDPNLFSASRFELLTASAMSLMMPADALLFKGGGALKNLKSVGKMGDFVASKIARMTNKPLPQVRVHVKNAIERITGGAGGFAAFDSGRSIVDQIEFTGTVDPLEVVEHGMKGAIVGSFTSGLGLAGSVAGKSTKLPLADKATEFAGEILGLGTVGPLVAGEKITAEGYFDAAGTVVELVTDSLSNANAIGNRARKIGSLITDLVK